MGNRIAVVVLAFLCCILVDTSGVNQTRSYQIPDEQRLYRELMWGYETSVRPVLTANSTVFVNFRLTLNQIIDLDERKQVLTTNVFIDQSWTDENLMWDPRDYNNIKTLRVHESHVWLPDTFLFNNADEGATGFMRGMYVLLNYNGTVLWPVPVKLKSSCKVDIAYFPFDDQRCQWRFGSWIYSGSWIDFHSSREEIDLLNFMDNSEWELLSIQFQKNSAGHTTPTPSPDNAIMDTDNHPDLLFTLHIRRRTLFYIFNIIAPCVMLSVLTLLTFWLPTTSGEKISLGLSVFLAFSMFMLLIAEEVPATSNSVPLIGIYLTTVMTMTSVSVIMAVMVINLYNRGSKAVHAPRWVRVLVLEGLSRLLCLKHDIDKLTDNIKLDKDEEAKYACVAHPPVLSRKSRFRRPSRTPTPSPPSSPRASTTVYNCARNDFKVRVTTSDCTDTYFTNHKNGKEGTKHQRAAENTDCCVMKPLTKLQNRPYQKRNNCNTTINRTLGGVNRIGEMKSTVIPLITITGSEETEKEREKKPDSPVWKKRNSVIVKKLEEKPSTKKNFEETKHTDLMQNNNIRNGEPSCIKITPIPLISKVDDQRENHIGELASDVLLHTHDNSATLEATSQPKKAIPLKVADVLGTDDTPCQKKSALLARRQIVVEWQTIATVIDRLLFWMFLVGTVAAYLVILFLIPYTKPGFHITDEEDSLLHALQRAKRHDLLHENTI